MFGVLRTTLALMVMINHLFFGAFSLGGYAVYGFYIISGYLMTLIMHESYSYSWIGRWSFAVNRFLRLYPQYWLASLISILLILIVGGEAVANYNESMVMPDTYSGYMYNLLMIFPSWNPSDVNPRLVPPAWALTVEIFFYILICLGLSKTFTRVKVWFLLSICYLLFTFIGGLSWEDRYFPVAAASLPFSIGSAIYFISRNKNANEVFMKYSISSTRLFVLMLANSLVWVVLSRMHIGGLVEIGFYINIFICAALVYSIVNGSEVISITRPLDKFIGDFSFPIYLLHWQSGLFVSYFIFGEAFHEFSIRGFYSFIVSLVFVAVLSYVFILIVDKPIQHVRSKVKANKELKQSLTPLTAES